MTSATPWLRLLTLSAALILGACGGASSSGDSAEGGMGGSGSGDSQYAEGGMGGSGSGTSSGYGSIIVNDTRHFPIDPNADVFVDGERVAPDAINDVDRGVPLGMTLEYVLAGDANDAVTSGTAIRIRANHRAIGPVTQVDPHLEVLGQPVLVTSETWLDGLSRSEVDELSPGDMVKVDGHVNAAGTVRATRVEQPSGEPTRWQLIGRLDGDESGGTFAINGQTVELRGEIPECSLTANRLVHVRASSEPWSDFGDSIDTTLEVGCPSGSLNLHGDDAPETLPSAVEGIITGLPEAGDPIVLSLNGQTVEVDPDQLTQILFGTLDDLKLGARIEVQGTLNTQTGVITAESIRFRDPLVTITAPIDGGLVDRLLLTLGIEVRPTPGMDDAGDRFGSPGMAGDATIRGFVTDDRTVHAEQVLDPESSNVTLKGPIPKPLVDDGNNTLRIVSGLYDTATADEIRLVSALDDSIENVLCSLLNIVCSDPPMLEDKVKVGSMGNLTGASWDASAARIETGTLEITQPSQ